MQICRHSLSRWEKMLTEINDDVLLWYWLTKVTLAHWRSIIASMNPTDIRHQKYCGTIHQIASTSPPVVHTIEALMSSVGCHANLNYPRSAVILVDFIPGKVFSGYHANNLKKTRSSPQWWSGRLMTAHTVIDLLHAAIWKWDFLAPSFEGQVERGGLG